MNKILPWGAVAFPESPRVTRRRLFAVLVAMGAAIPLAAWAQQPECRIRSLKTVRSVAGSGTDVVVEVVGSGPFTVGANGWHLTIGGKQFGNYTFGPKGEMNVLMFRIPAAQFSALASGSPTTLHYGDSPRPGYSLGRLNRSLLSR